MGYDEGKHPRGAKGQFTHKADSDKEKKKSSARSSLTRATFASGLKGASSARSSSPLAKQMVALAKLAPKLGDWAKTMKRQADKAKAASSKSLQKKSLAKDVKRYQAPKKDRDVGLKEGRHVEKLGIRENTRATLQTAIKNVINQAGLKGALARHPLGKIEIKTGKVIVTKNGVEKESHSSGVYDASTRKIQVRQDRKEGSWGKDFKPGEVHSMSQCARTKDQAVARTLLHEVGHHLFHQDDKLYKAAQKAYDSHGPKVVEKKDGTKKVEFSTKPGFSTYAQKSASEYMSEALVAFVFHRKALKEYDPAAYKLAARMVQTRGLNIKEPKTLSAPKEPKQAKSAKVSTYNHDLKEYAKYAQNDKQVQKREFKEYGTHSKDSLGVVPLSKVRHEPVWDEKKLSNALKGIDSKAKMPPVSLTKQKDGTYSITDGIHRYNAAKQRGLTHVPAIITEHIKGPPK